MDIDDNFLNTLENIINRKDEDEDYAMLSISKVFHDIKNHRDIPTDKASTTVLLKVIESKKLIYVQKALEYVENYIKDTFFIIEDRMKILKAALDTHDNEIIEACLAVDAIGELELTNLYIVFVHKWTNHILCYVNDCSSGFLSYAELERFSEITTTKKYVLEKVHMIARQLYKDCKNVVDKSTMLVNYFNAKQSNEQAIKKINTKENNKYG